MLIKVVVLGMVEYHIVVVMEDMYVTMAHIAPVVLVIVTNLMIIITPQRIAKNKKKK